MTAKMHPELLRVLFGVILTLKATVDSAPTTESADFHTTEIIADNCTFPSRPEKTPCPDVDFCQNGDCKEEIFFPPFPGQPAHRTGMCICDEGWTGMNCDLCQYYSSNVVTPPASVTPEASSGCVTSGSDSFFGGFFGGPTVCGREKCYNGICEQGSGEEWTCQCNQGWIGAHCDQCCDLPCDQGHCDIDPDTGNITCVCYAGFGGEFCNITTGYGNYSMCSNVTEVPGQTCLHLPHPCYHGDCRLEEFEPYNVSHIPSWCECHEGWVGGDCNTCCDLPCTNGTCHVRSDTGDMYCNCFNPNKTGDDCEILITPSPPTIIEETPTWYWWLVGGAVTLLVILALTTTILPYYLWKKRYIFIMELVHKFQSPEEGDVFIAYCDDSKKDRDFVVNKLLSKLETEGGYPLIFEGRNFVPGHSKADTIIEAVERSCRVVLILSPDFLSDEWTRFQTQMAQQQMLRLKNRIVALMFRDISDDFDQVDKNLKTIISSVYSLKWPGEEDSRKEEKFWKRLHLCMPKVKSFSSSK